jgi:hypothetical protein
VSRSWSAVIVAVWLSFTGAREARAQEQRWSRGSGSLHAGSVAGFAQLRGEEVVAIGGRVGAAFHLGPVAIGADWDYMGVGNTQPRGHLHRIGFNTRVDFARLDKHFGGENTSLALWVDGGAGRQRGLWHDGSTVDRGDFSVGAGWTLVHRVNLSTRPRRLETVGWRFGWRFMAAPRWAASNGIASCRRQAPCPPGPMEDVPYDLGMVVNSSLDFAW